MTRDQIKMHFESLVHHYTHMGDLPHEMAKHFYDATHSREYIDFWADYLLMLSNLVRKLGQGEQETYPAPDPKETSDRRR